MEKSRKGSSLVELLAVIVVLGIIAAIAVPSITGLLKSTKQKACATSMKNICSSYFTTCYVENPTTENQRYEIISEIMEGYNCKESETHSHGYEGICPSDGILVFEFDDEGNVDCKCTEHDLNHISLTPENILDVLSGLTMIDEYFQNNYGNSINSEYTLESGSGTAADQINAELANQFGFDERNFSWRIFKNSVGNTGYVSIYTYTFAKENINSKKPGDTVECVVKRYGEKQDGTKVLLLEGVYTLKVSSTTSGGKTYNVIDGAGIPSV